MEPKGSTEMCHGSARDRALKQRGDGSMDFPPVFGESSDGLCGARLLIFALFALFLTLIIATHSYRLKKKKKGKAR